jgi:hypothetical protein
MRRVWSWFWRDEGWVVITGFIILYLVLPLGCYALLDQLGYSPPQYDMWDGPDPTLCGPGAPGAC